MVDVRRVVETVFRTADFASKPLVGMASASMRTARAMAGMVSPLTAVVAGIASLATARGLVEMHGEVEDTRIALAGMFATLGQSSNFNQGLTDAEATMRRITVDAARLPGEAEDYIEVFRRGLPGMTGAIGGTTTEMAAFSNRYAAIMTTLQVSTAHSASGLARMLAQSRGAVVDMTPSFRALLPFIEQATRNTAHHVTNAREFNRLTQQQRGEVLRMTVNQRSLTEMLDASANTWGAQIGAFQSARRMLTRQATAPLFEAAKNALAAVNASLIDADGNLRPLGQTIVDTGLKVSRFIVGGFRGAIRAADALHDRIVDMGASVERAPWFASLRSIAATGVGVTVRLMENPVLRNAAIGVVARAALGPVGMLVGPMMAFATHTEAVNATLGSLANIGAQLATLFEPLLNLVGIINNTFGDMIAGVLPGLMAGIEAVIPPIVEFGHGVIELVGSIVTQLRPHLSAFAGAIGNLVSELGKTLGPILRVVGRGMLWLGERIAQNVIPAIRLFVNTLTRIINWIAGWMRRFRMNIQDLAPMREDARQPSEAEQRGNSILDQINQAVRGGNAAAARTAVEQRTAAAAAARRTTPGARGGHHTTNDFRNSRFDITQRFAEGFDPDRVAVAFASDLERMADQRLQSGLEPIFGVT